MRIHGTAAGCVELAEAADIPIPSCLSLICTSLLKRVTNCVVLIHPGDKPIWVIGSA
jgi:hypothetical protein